MKKLIVRSIVSTLALATLAVAPAVLAQQPTTLRGNWNSEVTLTDCNGNTLAAFRARQMFIQDGSLITGRQRAPDGARNRFWKMAPSERAELRLAL